MQGTTSLAGLHATGQERTAKSDVSVEKKPGLVTDGALIEAGRKRGGSPLVTNGSRLDNVTVSYAKKESVCEIHEKKTNVVTADSNSLISLDRRE